VPSCHTKPLSLVIAVVLCACPAGAEEYLLFRTADLKPPQLGDGVDPARPAADRIRQAAVSFAIDSRRNLALQASVSIHELKESGNALAGNEGSANAALKNVLQSELQVEDYASIFEEHSVFVVQAMLINRTDAAADLHLKDKLVGMPADAFRQKYGVRVVERIDYGGHIFLVYVFRTRKDDVRRKIISSLQAAYSDVSEKASFKSYLEKSGVKSEFTMHALQDGGDIAPFLNPNLADFRAYLDRWVASVACNPTPVRFYTARYHDVVSDFPHRWILGFGDTFSR
jgi:hypothetical protein